MKQEGTAVTCGIELSAWRSFVRRWPAAAVLAGVVALLPASIIMLTVPAQLDVLSAAGYLGLWFLSAGAFGGTAIALQHAFRQPRIVSPLFAAALVLLVGCGVWVTTRLLDPSAYFFYTLAVIAPFILASALMVTLTAAFIPIRYQKRVSISVVAVAVAITALSLLT